MKIKFIDRHDFYRPRNIPKHITAKDETAEERAKRLLVSLPANTICNVVKKDGNHITFEYQDTKDGKVKHQWYCLECNKGHYELIEEE